jgi:hypothetical protein
MLEYWSDNLVTIFRFVIILGIYFLLLEVQGEPDDIAYRNFIYEKGSRVEIEDKKKRDKEYFYCYLILFFTTLVLLILVADSIFFHPQNWKN